MKTTTPEDRDLRLALYDASGRWYDKQHGVEYHDESMENAKKTLCDTFGTKEELAEWIIQNCFPLERDGEAIFASGWGKNPVYIKKNAADTRRLVSASQTWVYPSDMDRRAHRAEMLTKGWEPCTYTKYSDNLIEEDYQYYIGFGNVEYEYVDRFETQETEDGDK